MAEIRWSLTAIRDLEEIEAYIARDSPLYALRMSDGILESIETLGDLPVRGRDVPEFERMDLREIIHRSYRLVYLARDETVTVLHSVHGARDLNGLVEREPWEIG
jgi:plasmid stabilization system protein ParE